MASPCTSVRKQHTNACDVLISSSTGVIAFTTTGYGDYTPTSPAGRSVFVVWALLGVATMTILISGQYSY